MVQGVYPVLDSPLKLSQTMSEMVRDRLTRSQAAEQEAKNPYVGQRELEALLMDKLKNKYYGREKESEIGLRGAQAGHLGSETQLNQLKIKYPGLGEAGIAGQIAAMRLQADHPEWAKALNSAMGQSQEQAPAQQPSSGNIPGYGGMTMSPSSPLAGSVQKALQQQASPQQQQPAINPVSLLARNIQATIGGEEAKANYYNQGGARGGVAQKNMNSLINAVQEQHPDWDQEKVGQATDAYLSGENKLPTGEELPPAVGRVQQSLQNVQGSNAPKALQTQFAQMDTLTNDLNSFDIDALSTFTGPQGAAKLTAEKLKMASGQGDVDPMARRYLTAVNQSILTMDQMRKAFGTSVVPGYVYDTLGKLANPNDKIWLDKKQVEDNFAATKNIMNRNRDIMKYKIQHGVTAEIPERLKLPENASQAKEQEKEVKKDMIKVKVNGEVHEILKSELKRAKEDANKHGVKLEEME